MGIFKVYDESVVIAERWKMRRHSELAWKID